MVAASVELIVKTSKDYVLICANSNAACDEITQRLLKTLKNDQIFRMYAKSYTEEKVPDDIKKCYNFVQKGFKYPCLNYLYKFRVVICTLLTAGHLMRARNDPGFNPSHFSYLFIDECASTHETASIIPIAGICCSKLNLVVI